MFFVFYSFCVGFILMRLLNVVGICFDLVVFVLSENFIKFVVIVMVDFEFDFLLI